MQIKTKIGNTTEEEEEKKENGEDENEMDLSGKVSYMFIMFIFSLANLIWV